jgi:hypothetical protein
MESIKDWESFKHDQRYEDNQCANFDSNRAFTMK